MLILLMKNIAYLKRFIDDESVGLIGVGLLGSALANRLMNDGRGVHGFDSNEEQLEWVGGIIGA
ncbi:MAG: hypothetical protein Aurels2KO_46660 [Aureliella sp.]